MSPDALEAARRLIEDECPIAEVARTVGVAKSTIERKFPDAHRMTRHYTPDQADGGQL